MLQVLRVPLELLSSSILLEKKKRRARRPEKKQLPQEATEEKNKGSSPTLPGRFVLYVSFFLIITHSSFQEPVLTSCLGGNGHLLRRGLKSLGLALQVASLDLGLHGADLLGKEINTLGGASAVGQMGRQHGQSTKADEISGLADYLDLRLGEVGDLIPIL